MKPKRAALDIDDWGVRRTFRQGKEFKVEAVAWAELNRVEILTTDAGPWSEDFFFILQGEQGGVLISNALAAEAQLVAVLQARLPDLDNGAISAAAPCTDVKTFRVWERSPIH